MPFDLLTTSFSSASASLMWYSETKCVARRRSKCSSCGSRIKKIKSNLKDKDEDEDEDIIKLHINPTHYKRIQTQMNKGEMLVS